MDRLTTQQLQILLSMTVLVHCAMGLILFGFARISNRNTLLWSVVGLAGGLVGLVAYIFYSLIQMGVRSASARDGHSDEELAAHLLSQTDIRDGRDETLDELISEGYLEKARVEARDKLQAAFNYGDHSSEKIYRGYVERIEELTAGAGSEAQS